RNRLRRVGALAGGAVEHARHLARRPRPPRFVLAEIGPFRRFECRFHIDAYFLIPIAYRLVPDPYTNNEETDVSSWMLLMACPSSRATESTTIFSHAAAAGESGIVLVTINLSIGDR